MSQGDFTSSLAVLTHSSRLYFTRGWVLTQPIILPSVFQMMGVLLAFGLPLYCALFFQAQMLQYPFLVREMALVLLSLPGVILMSVALWHYLVWMVALCQPAKALLTDVTPTTFTYSQLKAVYRNVHGRRYSLLLLALSVPWLLGLVIYGLGLLVTLVMGDPWLAVLANIGSLVALFMVWVFAVVVSVFLSLSIQVFCFEDHQYGRIVPILLESVRRVRHRLLGILMAIVGLAVVTSIMLPGAVNIVLSTTGVLAWISQPVVPLVSDYVVTVLKTLLQASDATAFQALFQMGWQQLGRYLEPEALAQTLVSMMVGGLVTLLMLPWGTLVFTGFYLNTNNVSNQHADAQ